MVNPLNIILPMLFRGGNNAVHAHEEYESAISKLAGLVSDELQEDVRRMARELAAATTYTYAEAARSMAGLIRQEMNKGRESDDAVKAVCAYIERRYLSCPLSVFDKRPDVNLKEDYAREGAENARRT